MSKSLFSALVFEEEEVVDSSETQESTYPLFLEEYTPWYIKEGFESMPGTYAIEHYSITDCAPDCNCYRREKGGLEEFLYFVDGWHPSPSGSEAEIFAGKALIRKDGIPILEEYAYTTREAFDELEALEKRLA